MASGIDRDDVLHVARLARLELDEGEIERFTEQLAVIIEHAGDLAALELDGVEPTSHPVALVNVLRPDEVGPTVDREEVLAQAPDVQDGRFRVPRILDAP
jgi:aspartyl-tRNA(Asn)/glutamyl-tRNA(Gln) amidotransferase subunit C